MNVLQDFNLELRVPANYKKCNLSSFLQSVALAAVGVGLWLSIYTKSFAVIVGAEVSADCHNVQWNLRITDTLGTGLLSFVERLSLSRRLSPRGCGFTRLVTSVLCSVEARALMEVEPCRA